MNSSSAHESSQPGAAPRGATRSRGDRRVPAILRSEFASGIAVLVAAIIGFALANSPLQGGFETLRDARFGPAALGLDLSVGEWTSDALLAIFFFVVGLELKREFAVGSLRRVSTSIVPIIAAVGGVAVPALIYFALNYGTPGVAGWAIPTATDIAFAVAILGVLAPGIDPALRLFLLTLAVVDDLIAIAIIAVFYSHGINWIPLAAAFGCVALFAWIAKGAAGWLERNAIAPWLVLLPVGIVCWGFMHASGIHATIAAVVLAFTVPTRSATTSAAAIAGPVGVSAGVSASSDPESSGSAGGLAASLAHRISPLSNWIAVPLFALFAAGVTVADVPGFPFSQVSLGVIAGLVLGKPIGILLAVMLLTRFTPATLGAVLPRQLIGVACLGGVGFTVALLVAGLSFDDGAHLGEARLAVMAASVISAVLAGIFLVRRRDNKHKSRF